MSQVYVSTYKKYNNGTLDGDWMSPADYSDKAEFLKACCELHEDESQPELMYQDWEDIPNRYINQSEIREELWGWLALDTNEQAIVEVYLSEIDAHANLQHAIECFCGKHDTEKDWAMNHWDESGMLDQVPEFAKNFIDYDKYAREVRMGGDIYFVDMGSEVWAYRSY